MTRAVDAASAWVHRGIWGAIVRWLHVPAEPPTLPVPAGDAVERFRPSPGFLRYLKFWFWLLLWPMDLAILVGWAALLWYHPVWAWALAAPAFLIAVVPDIVAYAAIHVRYDATCYAMSDRSLRIRRGIWVIREMTITFENVQNVLVRQGPVQRRFGVADVIVETAGGAASGPHGEHAAQSLNQGVLEGMADAQRLREIIMAKVRTSQTAGLGDEAHPGPHTRDGSAWTPAHLTALREVLAAATALRQSSRAAR